MEKYFEVLCMCPLFRDMAHWELTKALRCLNARVSSFEKGEAVMNEGEPAKYVGIVLTGSFQIVRTDFFGNRSMIANLVPGELFGESFACAGVEVVPVSVLASEAAEVMLIDCLKISHSCSNACQFHQQMIATLDKGKQYKQQKMDCQPYRKRRPAVKRAAFLRDRERRKRYQGAGPN